MVYCCAGQLQLSQSSLKVIGSDLYSKKLVEISKALIRGFLKENTVVLTDIF